ncbi:MAG TPA: indole-3-glycerol phosphate synthase TrpC [Solirubrobacteraceae bacterium]|jgi:indole-3-glycerol phosphate synthase|nr:indole-3-glycerol phosphate synthase TrpC [Solirubrobacteraceae bacterium]
MRTDTRPTVLARILEETRATLDQRKSTTPLEVLQAQVAELGLATRDSGSGNAHSAVPNPFREALADPGVGVIAEFKRRSPSAGRLREDADITSVAAAYEQGGASAMSVLTEEPNFEGSLDDLRAARAACALPILRKDFIVDPYQLYEAKLAGADAVLLIVAALAAQELVLLHETALGLGLDVLVEVHDSGELAIAASIGASLIGVNNRDLRDFSVDVARTSRLLGEMPAGATVVSESGIAGPEQLRELEQQGVAAVLVGESLMRAPDPRAALSALLQDPMAH